MDTLLILASIAFLTVLLSGALYMAYHMGEMHGIEKVVEGEWKKRFKDVEGEWEAREEPDEYRRNGYI